MADIADRINGWRSKPLADDPQHNWDWVTGMLDEAGAEIGRLRAALNAIAYGTGSIPSPSLDECIDIARNVIQSPN